MTQTKNIVQQQSGETILPNVRWCDTFGSKLRGFMFKSTLTADEGLVLVESRDNRVNSSIHMLFVNFDLGVIWVNDSGEIVDKIIAKPWRLSYVPAQPARYTIECHPSRLGQFIVGEKISFQ